MYGRWADWLEERAKLRATVGRLVSPGPGRAFLRWVEFLEEHSRLAALAARLGNGAVVRAFNTWVDSLGDRRKMSRFLRVRTHAHAHDTFHMHTHHVCGRHHTVHRPRHGLRPRSRPLLIVISAPSHRCPAPFSSRLARMHRQRALNRGLARSWERWLEMLEEIAKVGKFAGRILHQF